jgi:hypothetical protein
VKVDEKQIFEPFSSLVAELGKVEDAEGKQWSRLARPFRIRVETRRVRMVTHVFHSSYAVVIASCSWIRHCRPRVQYRNSNKKFEDDWESNKRREK